MNTTGGPIVEVKIKNRAFQVTQDNDSDMSLGGFKSNLTITGGGSPKIDLERIPSQAKGLALIIDKDKNDLEFLQAIVDGTKLVDYVQTDATGVSYGGKVMITSELNFKAKSSTIEIDVQGSKLKKL
jgi:hypothetical protein